MPAESNDNAPLAWKIDPLPDFLIDPGLTGEAQSQRLEEYVSHWIQFVGSLWGWHDKAAFALRYAARNGRINLFFFACAHLPVDRVRLENEISVLLRTHRLAPNPATAHPTAEELSEALDLPSVAIVRVEQYATNSLWKQLAPAQEVTRQKFPWLPPAQVEAPPVLYPWQGPGGPFLLPMESLLSQPVPCCLTILLQPTTLRPHEWSWLATMAQQAQTRAEQNLQQMGAGAAVRSVDPSASLAGKLYMAFLRRLSAAPFLTTVYCAAADGRLDVALGLAGAVQSLVHEKPVGKREGEEGNLPSGASVAVVVGPGADPNTSAIAMHQYRTMRFVERPGNPDLSRLTSLIDGRGAATVFRLPVSVRGGVPGIQVRQLPPDFRPGARQDICPPEHIQVGDYHAGGGAYMPLRDLTKHALVTGFTGSGKSVTVLQLLHQVWVDHNVPFLVLESAKQEYRGLVSVESIRRKEKPLRVYTLGNELCAPFRLNPFELLPGVRLETHMGRLQTCFEGAIPPIGPSASVINEALLRVYEQTGWSLTDTYPLTGRSSRRFPVLREFVAAVEQVLEDRAYEGEVKSNLRAALVGRFTPLLLGGKGRMFDTQLSAPSATELFGEPVVLEMNDLIQDDKALMVMFILTMLREHREVNKSVRGELKHMTVVEEAHNVLENVASEGSGEGATKADTRHKAVEAFCSMLTEIRSLGEGLLIADQSPEKLARDAIRNTNLQIAHQLRDGKDREAIANAMIMEKEQKDFLGKLRPGQAAMFRTGLEKATFVQVRKYYPDGEDRRNEPTQGTAEHFDWKGKFVGYGFDPLMNEAQLRTYMDEVDPGLKDRRKLSLPYSACAHCTSQCKHRDPVFSATEHPQVAARAREWFSLTDIGYREELGISTDEMWLRGVEMARDVVQAVDSPDTLDASWCAFAHLWDRLLRENEWKDAEDGLRAENRETFEEMWNTLNSPSVPEAEHSAESGPIHLHVLPFEWANGGEIGNDTAVAISPPPITP